MLSEKDKEFFGAIADRLNDMAKLALWNYRKQASAIVRGEIDNENEIDLILDYMLDFCYDDEILKLYKTVLRSIVNKYPRVVRDHVYAYYEMFEPEKIGLEADVE